MDDADGMLGPCGGHGQDNFIGSSSIDLRPLANGPFNTASAQTLALKYVSATLGLLVCMEQRTRMHYVWSSECVCTMYGVANTYALRMK